MNLLCVSNSLSLNLGKNPWISLSNSILPSVAVAHIEHNFDNCVRQHMSGAGSSPAGSVGRDLNLQKLNYQYLTTSVAVVLVVR